jgi:GNAT superfamily N-acetyltransferase
MTTTRSATKSDRAQVTNTLASAFARDPMFRWVAGVEADVSMESKLRIFFGAMAKLVLGRDDHLVFTTDDGAGAAVWLPPNEWKLSTADMLRALPAMLRAFSTKTPRMIGAFDAVEKAHPASEHYFLEAIGTKADMQSKGVGTAVIKPMLERCDAEGMPAYLESSNLQNVPFYVRHGFEVTGEIEVGKGAPKVTAMWRDPR